MKRDQTEINLSLSKKLVQNYPDVADTFIKEFEDNMVKLAEAQQQGQGPEGKINRGGDKGTFLG